MDPERKEKTISIQNLIIGGGLLWILFYMLGPLVYRMFDPGLYPSADAYKKYLIISYSIYAAVPLLFGVVSGFVIRKKPLLHSLIIGLVAVAMVILTLMPVKDLNIQTISIRVLIVLIPITAGALIGVGIKKSRVKRD